MSTMTRGLGVLAALAAVSCGHTTQLEGATLPPRPDAPLPVETKAEIEKKSATINHLIAKPTEKNIWILSHCRVPLRDTLVLDAYEHHRLSKINTIKALTDPKTLRAETFLFETIHTPSKSISDETARMLARASLGQPYVRNVGRFESVKDSELSAWIDNSSHETRNIRKLRVCPSVKRDTLVLEAYRNKKLTDYDVAVSLGEPQTKEAELTLIQLSYNSPNQNVRYEAYSSLSRELFLTDSTSDLYSSDAFLLTSYAFLPNN